VAYKFIKKILLTSDKYNSSNFQVAEIQSALKEADDNDFISNKELTNLIKKHGGTGNS
jgi:hypothetical protein